jgi:hypothetical protein
MGIQIDLGLVELVPPKMKEAQNGISALCLVRWNKVYCGGGLSCGTAR